jgi:anti-anti-sigma regulatory factor
LLRLAWPLLYHHVKQAMLKITTTNSGDQQTLVLEGKLVDPWVTELQKSWTEVQRAGQSHNVLVELKDVTVISQNGENLLFQMMREGATFSCRGVLTRHVMKQLERRCRCEKQSRKDSGEQ